MIDVEFRQKNLKGALIQTSFQHLSDHIACASQLHAVCLMFRFHAALRGCDVSKRMADDSALTA